MQQIGAACLGVLQAHGTAARKLKARATGFALRAVMHGLGKMQCGSRHGQRACQPGGDGAGALKPLDRDRRARIGQCGGDGQRIQR